MNKNAQRNNKEKDNCYKFFTQNPINFNYYVNCETFARDSEKRI